MPSRFAVAVLLVVACGSVFAQQADPRMYPGTDFPGNDLVNAHAASPNECAAQCMADGRCKAFTFNIPGSRCYLKWAASRFDGSLSNFSGVFESRPIVPPGAGGAPPAAYPVAPIAVPVGPPTSCSAKGDDVCSGCSISCPAGKQASCSEGEVHRTEGFSPTCWTRAKCECR